MRSIEQATKLHLQAKEVVRVLQVDMFGAIIFDVISDAYWISNLLNVISQPSRSVLTFGSDIAGDVVSSCCDEGESMNLPFQLKAHPKGCLDQVDVLVDDGSTC